MSVFRQSIVLLGLLGQIAAANAASVVYERDVRPIFKTHCFHCHGEGGELKGGLDLRLSRLIAKGGKNGAVIEPGARGKSRLFDLVASGKMPPERDPLSDREIETIGRWIDQGSKTLHPEPPDLDPDEYITEEERTFWAFQPVGHPRPPAGGKGTNPIDAFIDQRLAAEELRPSPGADKATLVRRAYFDLLGLPPTPEELDSAMAISLDDLIDRLLASPHYGERWARHWLDVVGYADSEGYNEADVEREWAWRYRDYVIRAFNDDMPFDRFIREQLAGDEMVTGPHKNLAPDQIAKLTATGFLRMVVDGTGSGGIDQALARNQVVAETVQVVGSALMGLTLDCARCHNHRYDPISQKDYYRMRAIFEPALNPAAWKAPSSRRISLYTDEDRVTAAEIEARAKKEDAVRSKKVEFYIGRTLEWKLQAMPENLREPLRAAYRTAAKERTDEQNALLKAHPSIRNISAGSLYLYDREYRAEIARLRRERAARAKELLEAARKQSGESGVSEKDLSRHDPQGTSELKHFDEQIRFYEESMSEKVLKDLAAQAKAIRDSKPEEQFIRALVEPAATPPVTRLFHRGDHEQPKVAVKPSGLSVIDLPERAIPDNDPGLPSSGRRTAFVERLTDERHPLTARVMVNRIWLHHFGQGLARNPGDFGRLGERPTHPGLLDWLARDFMEHGWKVKRLHRLIMTSDAWRRSSQRTPELDAEDPDNLLLGRMNVRRREAEAVRDAVLVASGSLNRGLFGKPVPVMEDEVGRIILGKENLDGERKPGKAVDLNGGEHRRSIYVQARRSRVLSLFNTFDAPDMSPNCTMRPTSTVAPQALTFMNGDFVLQHARTMAERVLRVGGETRQERFLAAWRMALSRDPDDEEIRRSTEFLESQETLLRERKNAEPELAAWTAVCHALLSANEFLYVD